MILSRSGMNWLHRRLTSGSQASRSSAVPCSWAIATIGRNSKHTRVNHGKIFIGFPKRDAECDTKAHLAESSAGIAGPALTSDGRRGSIVSRAQCAAMPPHLLATVATTCRTRTEYGDDRTFKEKPMGRGGGRSLRVFYD